MRAAIARAKLALLEILFKLDKEAFHNHPL